MSPPPPMPCSERNRLSWIMLWAMPNAAVPRTTGRSFRGSGPCVRWDPPSFPESGMVIVVASRQGVTSQATWLAPFSVADDAGIGVGRDRLFQR